MGIGLGSAYGVAGGYAALDDILAQRIAAQKYADAQKQQAFENRFKLDDAAQRRKYQDAQLASFAEQRAATGDLQRQTAADKLSDDLMPGDVLDSKQREMLGAAGRGSLMAQQSATLPSRQYAGFLRSGPQSSAPAGGVLRSVSLPGNPDQTIYRGTRAQRATQSMVDSFPENSRERGVLQYEAATGRNAPSIFMPAPPKEPTPHYQLQPLYDENGRPNGAISFDQLTGKSSPVDVGGNLRAPGRGQADDPELPRGVSNYLVQLRTKYQDYQQAMGELGRAIPQIQQAHPSFNGVKAANALRQLFGQPTGANSLAGLLGGSLLDGEGGSGDQFDAGAPPAAPAGRGGGAGPHVGERRSINGQLGEWDGRGWKPVR